jgi:D-alanyl-D-alanine carboxypeptidase
MKKHVITVIVICVISIILCGGIYLSAFQPSQPDYTAQLQSLIETKWTEYKANLTSSNGGVCMLILSPNSNYFVSTGMNATADTHFRAASTTKTFTGAAILLLHQEGKLRIDDKITDNIPGTEIPYVPNSADYAIPYKNEITIRQLLGHRAGVFDISNNIIPADVSAPYANQSYISYVKEELGQPQHTFTFDELVGVVASNQLSFFPPGTSYQYSNTGCSILGKIVERVSGMSYASFVEQYLLAPNGLSDTSLPAQGDEQQLPMPYMDGYLLIQGESCESTMDNMSPHVAEGNVITTPNNLAMWAKLLYSANAGLNQTCVDQMKDVKPTGEEHGVYGLCTTYTEGLGYGHNGAHIGYMTVMRYDPTTDVTVVIVSSLLTADDLYGEMDLMYDIGRSAKQILNLR